MTGKHMKFSLLMALALMAGCHEAFSIPAPVPSLPNGQDKTQKVKADFVVSDTIEFAEAVKLAVPGTIIEWADGEYENIVLKMSLSGTADSAIVFRAQTPGSVVFKGVSSLQLSGSYLIAEGFTFDNIDTSVKGSILTFARGSSDCRISNCKIDGRGSKASELDTKWVSIYGVRNEISHCSFIDKRNMGCLLVVWMEDDIVPHHRISDNYFFRPYTHYDNNGKPRNGQESLRIGTSTYSMSDACCTVTGNYFYRCNGERAEIISNKSCHNLYEGNLFEGGEGTLTLRHGNDCTVKGNFFLSGGRSEVGGVRIIGERHIVQDNIFLNLTGTNYKAALCVVKGESNAELTGYWTVKDCVVKDNIFKDCLYGIVVNYGVRDSQDTAPKNLIFSGNKIFSSKVYMIPVMVYENTPLDEIKWQDNIIFGGTVRGVTLGMSSSAPEIPDFSETIDKIRKNAGVLW
jgi:poly(beta-D-mannuronate) lyase